MTKKKINKKIAALGVEIQNNGDGYSYFTSLKTGNQIGDKASISLLNSLTLHGWWMEAEYAIKHFVTNHRWFSETSIPDLFVVVPDDMEADHIESSSYPEAFVWIEDQENNPTLQ